MSFAFSTTIHPTDFTISGCIAEDPRKCSVEFEVVWMKDIKRKHLADFDLSNLAATNNGCFAVWAIRSLSLHRIPLYLSWQPISDALNDGSSDRHHT